MKFISVLAVTAALVVSVIVIGAPIAAAKTCPDGFTHALIGGHQKCLHAGEYCARRYARQYRRYHFACDRVRGTYRLEHA